MNIEIGTEKLSLSVKQCELMNKAINLPHVQYRSRISRRIKIPEEFKPIERNSILYFTQSGKSRSFC